MNRLAKALVAGFIGSLTTNVLHEVVRRVRTGAPRVDILGIQALARTLVFFDLPTPTGQALRKLTLAADIVSNNAYFALTGLAPTDRAFTAGSALGLAAGIGAVVLPARIGLATLPTNRTPGTQLMTVGLYAAGGLATALSQRAFATNTDRYNDYFVGKHVVVTGGSRGLGFAIVRHLLKAGARVTICGRSADSLASAAERLDTFRDSLTTARADVRERDDCDRLVATAIEHFGPIDVLVNNAGVIEVGPAVAQTIADYGEAMDTHFWGPLYTTLAALPGMRARRHGHIVNVASIGGVVGVPHLAPYCASKFAQIGFTQALGAELAADGITMTSIVPGLMITGSPDHAIFKGQNRAEYAWFTLSDANPFLAVSADTAARRILRAIRRGKAQTVIGAVAKLAQVLNAVAPETTAALLRLAARLLPPPGGVGTDRQTGAQSHSAWTQNPLTYLNTAAAERNNQSPIRPTSQ